MKTNPPAGHKRTQLGDPVRCPGHGCLWSPERPEHRRLPEAEHLHRCVIPPDYYAPIAFPKFLFDAAWCSSSRDKGVSYFYSIVCDAEITCGRCGNPIEGPIWTREEAAVLVELTKMIDYQCLKKVIGCAYDHKVFTCSACNHTTHLKWDGLTAEDGSER